MNEFGFKPVVFEKGGLLIREAEKKGCVKVGLGREVEFLERAHLESLVGNIITLLDNWTLKEKSAPVFGKKKKKESK